MGMEVLGVSREIKCDGTVKGISCKGSFSRVGINEPLVAFVDSAHQRGWVYNPKTDSWFCPSCAEVKQD